MKPSDCTNTLDQHSATAPTHVLYQETPPLRSDRFFHSYEQTGNSGQMTSAQSVEFALIETLRYSPAEGYYFFEEHCQRLANSADFFEFACDRDHIREKLLSYAKQNTTMQDTRIRILLIAQGDFFLSHSTLQYRFQSLAQAQQAPTRYVKIYPEAINSGDILFQHKTTAAHIRYFYDRCLQNESNKAVSDILFINQQGFCTEGTRHNIIIEKNGRYFTPPTSDGCLPGIMRAQCHHLASLTEKSITLAELQAADKIYCVNSVNGWQKVALCSH